jgi:penicillin-insensitive murein endopeptidase
MSRSADAILKMTTALVVLGGPAPVSGQLRDGPPSAAAAPTESSTAYVYGRTTSGCIAGAVALPARGEGFVRRFPRRNTGFGHPELIAYVQRLGLAVHGAGLGAVQIGDMSLPRGGAFAQGHASHQTGLDVDIAFRTLAGKGGRVDAGAGMSSAHAPGPQLASVAAPANEHVEALLRLAAADEHVDRIFVAAKIKLRLCRSAAGDRGFLRVLRPWQGHEDHFHVRLRCPDGSAGCQPNQPVTSIPDDCEALSTWWENSDVPAAFAAWRASERAAQARDLPEVCRAQQAPHLAHQSYARRLGATTSYR